MKKPLISVIIPAYNIERYLAESIESILTQSIGFSDTTELIIVNDGSVDNTLNIAHSYQVRYPDNIIVIDQKNAGVSAARNAGVTIANGEFVHFFDGDDLLSSNYYKESVEFLNTNKQTDLVASKIQFFDALIDSHPLNYKFYEDHVIDLHANPDAPLLHLATVVFRRSAIESVRFDESIGISEDMKYLSDVLVLKYNYGVLKRTSYYYRKRGDGTSLINGKEQRFDYYLDVPKRVYENIQETWTKSGDATPIEYTLLYDISYRLEQKTQSILNQEQLNGYKESILNILRRVSDGAILKNRFLTVYKKIYVLKNKYGKEFKNHISTKGNAVYFDEFKICDIRGVQAHIDFLTKESADMYVVEGYLTGPVSLLGLECFIDVSGEKTPLVFESRAQLAQSFLGDTINPGYAFSVKVKVPISSTLSIVIGDSAEGIYLETGPFTRFGALKFTYRNDGDSFFKRSAKQLRRYEPSFFRHVQLELRFLFQILLNWRLRSAYSQLQKLKSRNLKQLGVKAKVFEVLKPVLIIAESIVMIPRAFILRTTYHIALRTKKRPIWIISDRGMAAGDNGEALFRYIHALEYCPADVYYVISKTSKDYKRIREIGPVLNQSSLRYKLKFLLADKILSSQADVETTNPFIRQGDHYIDLFTFDFIFLQHGIIRHDLSDWLNRFNKNIRLFVTSAQREYDSILNDPYYYSKKNVLLSGLARYDYLKNEPKRKLVLAPTYRKDLAKVKTDKNGKRRYDPGFKTSTYRKFYNDLMNDERVLFALKNANMEGQLYLHPALSSQLRDFEGNKIFKVMDFPYDYKTAFREGEILISDYSSVVFDFAYLMKPVLYAQFDRQTFFHGQSYDKSDFFNDEDDGFGPIYYDYETLVQGVLDTIKGGNRMDEKYKKRVKEFFYAVDTNNSQRIYEAVTQQDKGV